MKQLCKECGKALKDKDSRKYFGKDVCSKCFNELTKEKPIIKLTGENGNAFNLLGIAKREMRQNYTKKEINAFIEEATASDYDNLLRKIMKYCEVK